MQGRRAGVAQAPPWGGCRLRGLSHAPQSTHRTVAAGQARARGWGSPSRGFPDRRLRRRCSRLPPVAAGGGWARGALQTSSLRRRSVRHFGAAAGARGPAERGGRRAERNGMRDAVRPADETQVVCGRAWAKLCGACAASVLMSEWRLHKGDQPSADHSCCSFSTSCWLLQSRQGRCWGVWRCVRSLQGAGGRQCRSHVQLSPAPGARGLGSRCGPQPR